MDAILDAIIDAHTHLIAALDSGSVAAIELATVRLSHTLHTVAGATVEPTQDARARVDHALRQSEAAGLRINYLADRNRQKLAKINPLRGELQPALYGSSGQYCD